MRDLLRLKLNEALTSSVPPLTRRDVRLPNVPGKALAVIGVRRCGKTTMRGTGGGRGALYKALCQLVRRQGGARRSTARSRRALLVTRAHSM